jgi:uncharacterized protein (TIRG00374 family)
MRAKKINHTKHKGRLLFWVLILLAIVIVSIKFADLRVLYLNILKSDPIFIFLALVAQLFYFIIFTVTYRVAFNLVDIKYSFKKLFPLTFVYIFVNVVAPTGGASGSALFATEASHRKESPIRALAGVLLANLGQFITFCVVLSFGALYLYSMNSLRLYQILASFLFALLTGLLLLIFFLGIKKPTSLNIGLHWVIKRLNTICKFLKLKKRFNTDWVNDGVKEFSVVTKTAITRKKQLRTLFYYYFLIHLINIISLYFVFLAFDQHILFRALVAGFVMGIVFQIIGITPYGIGLTESVMALTFSSLGIPTSRAILITLTYRGITFWLPFLIGFVLLRKIRIFGLSDTSLVRRLFFNKQLDSLKK